MGAQHATRLIWLGGEVPSHRTLLVGAGVKAISVNYWRLKKRGLPTTKDYLFDGRVPEDISIYLTSGSASAIEEIGEDDAALRSYADEYINFAQLNKARLSGLTDFDSPALSAKWLAQHRADMDDEFDGGLWVVWHHDRGPSLDTLAQQFGHVALPGASIDADPSLQGRLRGLSSMYGVTFHALGHSRPDDLQRLPVATVSTNAWLAPMMRGETVAWEGTRLVRYPQTMKDQARARLGAVVERAGLDHQKILADDATENTRLAIWSYQQLEARMNLSDNKDHSDDPGDAETAAGDPANKGLAVRNAHQVVSRPPDEQINLPVFSVEAKTVVDKDADGHDVVRDVPVMRSNSQSLRQCNTCFVAANCPAFKPNNTCAFNLPVSVKTKEQLSGLLDAVIEMQASRVAFARFTEELNGGYPDQNVSREVDRLFKLVESKKKLEDNREFLKVSIERQGAGGVLSSIFGERASTLRELPGGGLSQEETDKILKDGI